MRIVNVTGTCAPQCVALLTSVLHLIASHRTAVGENVGAEASILVGAMTTSVFFGSGTAKSTGHLKGDSTL